MIALSWLALFGILASLASMIGLGGPVVLGLALVAAACGARALATGRGPSLLPEESVERAWFLLLLLGCGFSFFYLFYEARGAYWTRNPNNLGDLPMHIHFIRYFARGGTLADSHPLLAGAPFKYPAAIDLWDAGWSALGVPLRLHLFLTGAVCTVLTLGLLRTWSGWWGVLGFVMSGGFSSQGLGGGWGPAGDLAWKNLFLAVWVTQRGFLFALPAGVYLLLTHRRWTLGERAVSTRERATLALLWGALPYFHLHSFLIVSFFLFAQCLDRRDFRLFRVLAWALPLTLIPIARTLGEARGAVHWSGSWMAKPGAELLFWIKNFALWLLVPVALWLAWALARARSAPVLLGLTTLITFLGVNVMLAPWEWDQIKILIWIYFYWNFLFARQLWENWRPWVKAFALVAVFFFGFHQWISGLPGLQPAQKLWSVAETELAAKAVAGIDVRDAVLVAPGYDHPILATGQQLWFGYEGHLWSHQLDYAENKRLLDIVKENRSADIDPALLAPRWVLFGPRERDILGAHASQEIFDWQLVDFRRY